MSPPAWIVPINILRSALVLLAALVMSIFFECLQRFLVLPLTRNNQAKRIARLNPVIKTWGIMFATTYRIGLGLHIDVKGTPPESRRCFIVCNHQSSLDIPLLFTTFRKLNLKFVAMEELRRGKPAVSLALRNGGFAFVAKRSLGKDLAALKKFAAELEMYDGSPLIFPEGRRTDDGSILPFQLAGMEIVRKGAHLPLVPVTVDGFWKAATIREMHRIVGSTISVRISDAIPFEETEKDPRAVYKRIEDTIRDNMRDIRRGERPEVQESS